MALETIKPYFRAAMLRADPNLVEWEDAFNVDNIPQTQLDCAWHLTLGTATFVKYDQGCLWYNVPLTLQLFFKGYRTPAVAVDNALLKAEAIIKESCRHSFRLSQPYIKNLTPKDYNIEALTGDNDNTAKLVMTFECSVHIDLET
jgi:hypothetical protein